MNYVAGAVQAGNTIGNQVSVSTADVSQLLNETKSMNESQFLAWAQKGAGVVNPVIDKIAAITNNTTFPPALQGVWTEIQAFKSGAALGQISSEINKILNETQH